MQTPTHQRLGAAVLAAVVASAGCNVDVRGDGPGRKGNVDIRTPIGSLSVRSDGTAPDTGLPTYPDARPLGDDGEPGSADVNLDTSWFGVKVAAARFESDDAQQKIIDFYRQELQAYGEVTECRGNVDFKGSRGARRPVCKESRFSREIQLAAGSEGRQRVVAVKPRGDGSEFALIYVQMRARD